FKNALESEASLYVSVNGVDVGSIKKSDFFKIKLDAVTSQSVAIGFFGEAWRVLVRIVNFIIQAGLMFLLFSIAVTVFSGQELTNTIIQAITENEIINDLKNLSLNELVKLITTALFVAMALTVLFNEKYFFRSNPFTEFISDKVRERVGCPAIGVVKVYSLKPDSGINVTKEEPFVWIGKQA
ncbi:MAG: hypothetical protein K0U21_06750, partial [Proteobacteria bacterium]|nr:hypothetical protein [Pseudomonadota bacterium]